MDSTSRTSFRVPKKTTQRIIESLDGESDQKKFLQIKLMESFKRPEISRTSMQFSDFWSIKNPESELLYSKKRQSIKANGQNIVEYFGFLYVKSESELNKLATYGKLKNGNVIDSKLGTGSMGVSLSQFSDIYHPGENNYHIPSKGILLIVKYMRGKINYVVYDNKPTEPQPDYDCHIVRNGSVLETNVTVNKAFHATQVFLYEYSEDLEVLDYPSQLLIIGAVKFTWTKKYLFRTAADVPNIVPQTLKRRLPDSFTTDDPVPRKSQCKSLLSKLRKPNVNNDFVPLMSGDLICGSPSTERHPIGVILMTRFKEPIYLHSLTSPSWNLTEVIPNKNFFEFFHYMDDKGVATVLKVSSDRIVQLPPKFYDGKVIPSVGRAKHVIHLSMIPSSLNDKKALTKLMDNLSQTGNVGRVTNAFLPNILFFVFPSGKMSDTLGIPRDDGVSLHVLLLLSVHPEMGCSYNTYHSDEYKFITVLQRYYSQSPKQSVPLIPLELLKQSVINQSELQKELYKKLLTTHNPSNPSTLPSSRDGSDMEVDSESERDNINNDSVCKANGKLPLAPPLNSEAPIRMPHTLPDSICIDSPAINWKQLSKSDDEDDPIEKTPSIVNGPHKEAIDPSRTPVVTQQPLYKPLIRHSVFVPPVSSVEHRITLLPTPVAPAPIIVPAPLSQSQAVANNHNSVPHEPYGHFRLVTLPRSTLTNNWRQQKHWKPVSNSELMPDVNFASIYKG